MTMKNVHVIPTDKPSRLFDFMTKLMIIDKTTIDEGNINRHIYITSDEEIKEGDWVYSIRDNWINKCVNPMSVFEIALSCKKIILTTDQDLISEGVQPIDDTFLEWFVKNPSCERVEVGYGAIRLTETDNKGYWISTPDTEFNMQIEEPNYNMKQEILSEMERLENEESKQETLEEAAESLYPFAFGGIGNAENDKKNHFIKGAKWQEERMYSEEEVRKISLDFFYHWWNSKGSNTEQGFDKWFEQNKKK